MAEMKQINPRLALTRDFASGTKASEQMLHDATARLSFRRARDVLPTKIETPRLILRAPIRGDVPALTLLANNPNIAEKLARLPSPYTRADATAFVEIFAQRPDERPYAITLNGTDLIGIVGFTFAMGQYPELGYWLGEPHWGKGIMSEAVKALLETAFATGAYPTIRARALQTNTGSINVLTKAGFKKTGKDRDSVGTNKGKPVVLFKLERPR